ncbi:MAG TPA: AAA family ATPase [Candidatus Dormibacteraeota bacterium]|nr:AAA family ATPase [Candidatus Dormibacteraeota bacterium]
MKFWRRHSRTLRLSLIWLAVAFVGFLVAAALFGIDDGSGNRMSYSPATATRNLPTLLPSLLRGVVPNLLTLSFALMFGILQFVGIFWYMSRGRTYTIFPGEYDLSFDDVRGQSHIVRATKEVMKLFQGFKAFKQVGGYPPHGILFEGPPGTGKTLLAKAIAGETGVPFMYASGASFTAMFLGVGNLRISRMFKKARLHAEKWGGCVVFIDELDAVAEARGGVSNRSVADDGAIKPHRVVMPNVGGGMGSQLVNELLTQMDGIDQPKRFRRWIRRMLRQKAARTARYNVLVVGATNRAAALDPALLRPGRFDRMIHVGNPGEEGRKDIIAYYLNKVAHAPIDIERVARATSGYSPARIRNIINEALIFALQDGRSALTYDDIWKAKLIDEVGLVEPVEYSDRVKAAVAIHEAGHAITSYFLRPWQPVQIVTVRKRGEALGLVHSQDAEERHLHLKSQIIADIKVSLAGMVAEELWLGESGTGPSNDLQAATGAAFAMIAQFGMGTQLASLGVLADSVESDVATAMRDPRMRQEIDDLLQECKREVRTLLEQQRPAMEALRDALVKREELTGDEFVTLLWEIGAIAEPPRVLAQLPVRASSGNGDSQRLSGFPGVPEESLVELGTHE